MNPENSPRLVHAAFLLLTITLALSATAAAAPEEKVLHTFQGTPGGLATSTLVADAAGNLYGTTENDTSNCAPDCGAAFELERTQSGWSYHVLHVFKGGADGSFPGDLNFDAAGNLYGSTGSGGINGFCSNGNSGCGTVFKLIRNTKGGWSKAVLYKFQGGSDGSSPGSKLVFDADGNLYGAANNGGLNSCNTSSGGCGTVFEIDKSGAFSVLYTFQGGSDGAFPGGIRLDASGNLFGVTLGGGGSSKCYQGCGTSFELTHGSGGWSETILHAFTGGSDGLEPAAAPVFDASGNVYGTTGGGGSTGCSQGCGVVFELTNGSSGWRENVLYTFQNYNDGWDPFTGVVFDANGNLYGVAQTDTHGLVYELTPTSNGWTKNTLYRFAGGSQGDSPYGVLLDTSGNVYGTTYDGGHQKGRLCQNGGCGVVYELIQ